ncbi:MAG TPA: oxidoreductase [Firmicutes bacterium]|nr:oxidoreductase [Bacillota bacterium]
MLSAEKVLENRVVVPDSGIYKLVLEGEVAATARPGQFVHLQVGLATDPLLRRPVSIAGIDRGRGIVTLFYRVAGRGTALLAGVGEQETLSVIGPLGNGFTLPQAGELLLLAGGIGIFPLFSLMDAVDRSKVKVKVLWGAENRQLLEAAGRQRLVDLALDYEVSTIDGSMGQPGLITNLLESYLRKRSLESTQQRISAVACGPPRMLKVVTEICLREGLPVEVSLEERMACGVGACRGCVCTVRTAGGTLERRRVCKDGPVFKGREVVWDAEG